MKSDAPLLSLIDVASTSSAMRLSCARSASASIEVDGETVELTADDVIVSERPREGWSVVNDQGETVALDLELDDELRLAGFAREAIRVIQEARKSSGLDISDRITLSWSASGPMADALRAHDSLIADEVLATSISESDGASDFTDEELGFGFALAKA